MSNGSSSRPTVFGMPCSGEMVGFRRTMVMRMMFVRRLSVMHMQKKIVMGEMVLPRGVFGFVVAGDLVVRLARYCSRYSFPRR